MPTCLHVDKRASLHAYTLACVHAYVDLRTCLHAYMPLLAYTLLPLYSWLSDCAIDREGKKSILVSESFIFPDFVRIGLVPDS